MRITRKQIAVFLLEASVVFGAAYAFSPSVRLIVELLVNWGNHLK